MRAEVATTEPIFNAGDIVELSPLAYEELPDTGAWEHTQRTGEVMCLTKHGNVRVQWWHASVCYAPHHLQHATNLRGGGDEPGSIQA